MLGVWVAALLATPTLLVLGLWIDAASQVAIVAGLYLLLPIFMAITEDLARGHTNFTAWFWGGIERPK